jgi:glycine cleavage system T protein
MNSRFLPPDIPPSKAGGGGGSLSSKKVRPQNSINPIPSSRDFSLLTALVGAMIVNESERNLHQEQPTSFSAFLQDLFSKSVSSDSSTQAIISVAALESLEQVQEYLESISQSHVISFADVENVLVSATGYTGAGGVEIYFETTDTSAAEKIWNAIFAVGEPHGLKPAGLGCRDTLRLEMGFCLFGNDIDDTTSPLEAGLGWITKFTKEFTNSEHFAAQKAAGLQRKLVGIEMIDKGIPRHGYKMKNAEGAEIGVVTSGTQSPSLNKAIGMAYLVAGSNALDTEVFVEVRDKLLKAKVVKLPFYQA